MVCLTVSKYLYVSGETGTNFQKRVNMKIEAGACKEIHLIVDSVDNGLPKIIVLEQISQGISRLI